MRIRSSGVFKVFMSQLVLPRSRENKLKSSVVEVWAYIVACSIPTPRRYTFNIIEGIIFSQLIV